MTPDPYGAASPHAKKSPGRAVLSGLIRLDWDRRGPEGLGRAGRLAATLAAQGRAGSAEAQDHQGPAGGLRHAGGDAGDVADLEGVGVGAAEDDAVDRLV